MKGLIPETVAASCENAGCLPFAFQRRFYLLLLVGLVWIAPAWMNARFLYGMALWDLFVLALWALDLRRLPRPDELEVRRLWKEPPALAQKMNVTIEVRNTSRASIAAEVLDKAPDTFTRTLSSGQVTVAAGSSGQFVYPIEPRARGDARFGDIWLRYRSAWRLAERWARARAAQEVRVYPSLQQAQNVRLYMIRSRQIELEKRFRRQRGQGREFESLREYREGDEFRDISWSATARRGKLITKVHQIERSQTIWLVLDAGRLLRARVDRLTKLDYTISAALSLAQVAFYSGDRVALLAYGRKPQQRVGPGRGVGHLRVLMESLSQVRAEALEADHLLAAENLLSQQGRRSLIVWLTDLAETAATPEVIECAAKMATRHLVLMGIIGQPELRRLIAAEPGSANAMYRYTAALEVVQRRELLLRRLRQQGALTLEVDASRMSTALVNRYLEVKERSLL
jgi:uncharacterized protein (DUF58 family)